MNEDSARHINLHHHITPGICCNSANIVSIVFECFPMDVIVFVSFRFRLPGCCAIWLRPAPGARAAHPTEGLELRLHACNARQPLHPDLKALSLSLSLCAALRAGVTTAIEYTAYGNRY